MATGMSATAYYNEHEPFAAAWLRNLIAADLIAPGEVDERSIVDVQPDDVRSFKQCHFFAGIGIWSLALRRAGWGDDRRVWTGSCPCQGFSVAGAGKGFDDERHLWPEFFRLIRECRPPVVLGEQVASPLALAWLDLVHDDLEGAGYAVGSADLCASSVGAPHIRQRLYWVGNTSEERRRERGCCNVDSTVGDRIEPNRPGDALRVADSGRTLGCTEQLDEQGQGLRREAISDDGAGVGKCGSACGLGHSGQPRSGRDTGTILGAQAEGKGQRGGAGCFADQPVDAGSDGRLADTDGPGQQRTGQAQPAGRERRLVSVGTDPLDGFWRGADWLACTDGKARPVEPGTSPLAHGYTGRVGQLRAYGNSLCEEVAQEFVEAVMECLP